MTIIIISCCLTKFMESARTTLVCIQKWRVIVTFMHASGFRLHSFMVTIVHTRALELNLWIWNDSGIFHLVMGMGIDLHFHH